MMKKLLDLRFVIGLFFLVVGALLVLCYCIIPSSAGKPETINLECGSVFLIFALIMLFSSFGTVNKKETEV